MGNNRRCWEAVTGTIDQITPLLTPDVVERHPVRHMGLDLATAGPRSCWKAHRAVTAEDDSRIYQGQLASLRITAYLVAIQAAQRMVEAGGRTQEKML